MPSSSHFPALSVDSAFAASQNCVRTCVVITCTATGGLPALPLLCGMAPHVKGHGKGRVGDIYEREKPKAAGITEHICKPCKGSFQISRELASHRKNALLPLPMRRGFELSEQLPASTAAKSVVNRTSRQPRVASTI